MSTSFCGHCGETAQVGERFCVACGQALRRPAAESPPAGAASRVSGGPEELRHAIRLLADGEPAAAASELEAICAAKPGFAVARAYLGIAYLRTTRVDDARVEVEEAVRLAPRSFICLTKHAEFLARLGFYDQAFVQLEEALKLEPPDTVSRIAALELANFCKDKSKGIYYRSSPSPLAFRPRNLLPRLHRVSQPAVTVQP